MYTIYYITFIAFCNAFEEIITKQLHIRYMFLVLITWKRLVNAFTRPIKMI